MHYSLEKKLSASPKNGNPPIKKKVCLANTDKTTDYSERHQVQAPLIL